MLIEGTLFDHAVHIFTALVAVSIFGISLHSYLKNRRPRFFIICAAFFLFAVKEVIIMVDVLVFNSHILVGISHFLNFVVLILFFWGVIK